MSLAFSHPYVELTGLWALIQRGYFVGVVYRVDPDLFGIA